MKIGIIRGSFLNKWEMQTFELLSGNYEITAFTSVKHYFDINEIILPIKIQPTISGKLLEYIGYNNHMLKLEEEIKLLDVAHTVETIWAFSYQCVKVERKYGL